MILALAAAAALGVPPAAERTPNFYHQPSYCRSVVEREVSRQNTAFNGRPPMAQYAVARSLDGCAVPTPVGYHPRYVLDGAADTAARREDAPSNRR
jgi:hypothetical protein